MEAEPLITSWGDYEATVAQLIPMAQRSIAIFDQDLQHLRLENPGLNATLQRFLRADPDARLRIAVHNAEAVRHRSPRTLDLLRLFAHSFQLIETPPHLASLADSLLLIDEEHALVRFHRDHARGRKIIADPEATQAYRKRFDDIWNEGGTPISATTIGL